MNTKQYIRTIIKNFFENGGSYRAAALSYTSLLSIVPFFAVVFAVMSLFPIFDSVREPLRTFIFENFLPASGKVVQAHVVGFVEHASELPAIGSAFLFATALLLIYEIERAVDAIWRESGKRRYLTSFLIYVSMLTIAPLLVSAIFLSTTLLISSEWLLRHHHLEALSQHFLLPMLPKAFTFLLLFIFYLILPKRRVRLSQASIGALFAATLIELGRWGFLQYLSRFHTYELLYGAFATIPIFLVWVYWLWIIVLFGGEITHALNQADFSLVPHRSQKGC